MAYDIVVGRSAADMKKYGMKGTILIAKHYVKMGQTTTLSNKVYMDIAKAHVLFICGKRGGGKCLSPDSSVHLVNGFKTIKEIFDFHSTNGLIVEDKENEQLIKTRDLQEVLSFNFSKITTKPIQYVYRKKIHEKIMKIVTKKGFEINATMEHPLLVNVVANSSNTSLISLKWIESKDLNVGDSIAIYNNDIQFDDIAELKEFSYSGWVYDLTIPETHNFISNNIICHNSYTMGVIAEGMLDLEPEVKNNLSIIMLDTMGVYWTMKYPNHKDEELLKEWGLEGKGLNVTIYTPKGYFKKYKEDGIPTDFPFAIKPNDLDVDDWLLTFDLKENDPIGVLIMKTLHTLRKEKPDFSIKDFIEYASKDETADKNNKEALISRLKGTEDWGLFDPDGTAIKDLAAPGAVVVLDVSCYATMPGGWKVKSLVIGIVAKKLFIDRMISRKFEEFRAISGAEHYFDAVKPKDKEEMPLVWLVIDEAHEFLPKEGKTSSTDALVTIMREGRQPGISLILATQQPGKIHTDVMTQSDIVLSHRITAKMDVDALGLLMQSYMRKGLSEQLDQLPRVKGAAILFDDSNERMYPIRIRPRFTWHGGEAPMAVHKQKKSINL